MVFYTYNCPNCDEVYEITPNLFDQEVLCSTCGNKFIIEKYLVRYNGLFNNESDFFGELVGAPFKVRIWGIILFLLGIGVVASGFLIDLDYKNLRIILGLIVIFVGVSIFLNRFVKCVCGHYGPAAEVAKDYSDNMKRRGYYYYSWGNGMISLLDIIFQQSKSPEFYCPKCKKLAKYKYD